MLFIVNSENMRNFASEFFRKVFEILLKTRKSIHFNKKGKEKRMIKQKFNKRIVLGFMQGGFATCWI